MNQTTHTIIVNYNAGQWLIRSLSAALAHSDGPVSVVDNASTDSSFREARTALGENPRLQWFENTRNLGFARAVNQVLKNVEQPFTVILNPDCEINAQTLPQLLEAFDQAPKMGLASCRILNEDGSIQATSKRRFPTPWSGLARILNLSRWFPNQPQFADFDYAQDSDAGKQLEFVPAISGAFMVVRRSAWQQIGLLDEGYFMHCEDLDWCKRFEAAGWQVGYLPGASVVHAKGVSSASRPLRVQWTLHRGMNRFFDKFYSAQYAWPIRWLVKIGIFASFILRGIRTLWHR